MTQRVLALGDDDGVDEYNDVDDIVGFAAAAGDDDDFNFVVDDDDVNMLFMMMST